MFRAFVVASLLGLPQFVVGWGAGVHPVIGHLAELYFLDATKNALTAILAGEPQYDGSIGEAANWADQTRSHLTEPWHFIDAEDNPPSACSVNLRRDCGAGGCVVSAIGNNSQILRECLSNNDVSKPCSDALKYIVHFFGDITQPLHCSSYERGGNQIEVRCQNRRRNFHSCWDTYIPDILEDQIGSFDTWPAQLKTQIDASSNSFLSQPTEWVSCVDPSNIENCAFAWAKDSNAFTCSYVYNNLDTSVDICGDYATGAIPIIETQIAKAGLRLAVYLNLAVVGQPGWGENVDSNFRVQS